ncbi:MAG: 2-amino-4-hydroxy-6-hydroxymethyldihydropteridine diphosphokinase, partial [Paludisphaera borealis]|uniref:2-amino-4-hydroxy-6- hydroxymethyldihydropteridine diphosphokinase n=1 Tax=Paludisphaera borealis TaxID=1387353 RepID=UPI0028487900
MSTGSLAIIGLGSNLGDRGAILDEALDALQAEPHVHLHTISSYYESPPIGGPSGQGPFLNAAALLEPALDPLSLLELLHRIEARFGRERTERWGSRTLDLDLLLYGEEVRRTPQIIVPHPRLAFRRFALVPAVEVAPWSIDPHTGLTINELLTSLDRRPSLVALAAVDPADAASVELVARVQRDVVNRLGAVALKRGGRGGSPATDPPAPPIDRHKADVQAIARPTD